MKQKRKNIHILKITKVKIKTIMKNISILILIIMIQEDKILILQPKLPLNPKLHQNLELRLVPEVVSMVWLKRRQVFLLPVLRTLTGIGRKEQLPHKIIWQPFLMIPGLAILYCFSLS